ncbi:MAG: DUF86 domain-containing protein [Desulfococcaceae bacterium]
MIRQHFDFIKNITDSINDIEIFVKGLDFDRFCEDRKTVYAVIRAVEIIGEAVKNIHDTTKKDNPDIPWKQLAGMRDKLIHGYFGVDMIILMESGDRRTSAIKICIFKNT